MNKYPEYIMRKVRQNLSLEADDTSMDDVINNMDKTEVFNRVLVWEGIIGYCYTIQGFVEDIWGIELSD